MTVHAGLVSTIIPVYNRQDMLVDAVESVINQTYRPIEIIIVNDGSTDQSLENALALKNSYQFIQVISIDNSGPGLAREAGRQQAKGEFIQYLDSDDLLETKKFSSQVSRLTEMKSAAACYGKTNVLRTSDSSVIAAWKRTGEKIDSLLPSMLEGRWWATSSALYRRSACDAAGPWRDLVNEEDWEYDCRLALSNNNLCFVDELVSTERHHQGSRLSSNGSSDVTKLASRATAHQAVVSHALDFGLDSRVPEFEHLLISCFLLARQCGAAGLTNESKQLIMTARTHLNTNTRQRFKLVTYSFLCKLFGWQKMGVFSEYRDKFTR